MSSDDNKCEICTKRNFRYICPKCNIKYCSVPCYRAVKHSKCSESFYKKCIQDELKSSKATENKVKIKKMFKKLKRIREEQEINPEDIDLESLDSDDDLPEDEVPDLIVRIKGINLNNPDEVWSKLTTEEKNDFHEMLNSGKIYNLIPEYVPWWEMCENTENIIDILEEEERSKEIPKIVTNIIKLNTLFSKKPSICVSYNLWNIIAAYTSVVRFQGKDFQRKSLESFVSLLNLSTTLKYSNNFESSIDAITSVYTESVTGKCKQSTIECAPVVSMELLRRDTCRMMACKQYKLAALSDLLYVIRNTLMEVKEIQQQKTKSEFLFEASFLVGVLSTKRIRQFEQKILFYLSFIDGDNDEYS